MTDAAKSAPREGARWRVRRAHERGHADHGWLDTHHTFSFAGYFDPRFMGFGPLRVLNDDRVAAGAGFPTHPHRDMEIITYVVDGALEHKDTTGGGGIIRPGDVQHMSAGTGVLHSEYNASRTEPVRFLQIWILPERAGKAPRYQQLTFPLAAREGRLVLVASPDGREGSLALGQDVELRVSVLGEGQAVSLDVAGGRRAWVQVARGAASLDGLRLEEGDGAWTEAPGQLTLVGREAGSELLVFDLG